MTSTLRTIRLSMVALVAAFVLSWSGDAFACSAMKSDQGGCGPSCGCCSPAEAPEPDSTAVVPDRVTARAESPATRPCDSREACSCRPRDPGTPLPKPARAVSRPRSQPGLGLDPLRLVDRSAARISGGIRVVPIESPPKIPIYLRNSRLLF